MAEYQLRSVDPDLWHRFKTRALAERKTIKEILLRLITRYADGK